MNYIFIDLELNYASYSKGKSNIRKPKLAKLQEIIEIGAIKTDENFNYIDTFRIFVTPNIFKSINPTVTILTGIKNEDLEFGFILNKSIKLLRNWIGNEDFSLFTWGDLDEKVLKENCALYNINSNWINCIDVQQYYMITIDFNNFKLPSLENVLMDLKLEMDRNIHSALNDAIYTMQIFKDITQKYDVNLLNDIINKRKRLDLYIDKYLNKEIKCIGCGKTIEDISLPLAKENKYGIIGNCQECDVYYYNYITWKFELNGDLYTDKLNNLEAISCSKYNRYRKGQDKIKLLT